MNVPPLPTDNTIGLPVFFNPGGIQFKDASVALATVCHNGISPDDPRVMERTNEATQIIMNLMIPVGGMATYYVQAINEFLYLPPQLENCVEAYPVDPNVRVRGDNDITQGWYELQNNSVYLDPNQHHDNPLVDGGLWPDASDPTLLRRVYRYPGLQPNNSLVAVTGKKRYIPIKSNDDYLIVQNLEALKYVILSIERNTNAAPDEAPKYLKQATELLEAEVKNHLLDPRNYMRRKSAYQDDLVNFQPGTLGYIRANIALDVNDAIKTGKIDLTFKLNMAEQRIMQKGIYKDCVTTITANVTGGAIYFPVNVSGVLAIDLSGRPIPIRSQFFQHLENGPGMYPCHEMLIDEGDQLFPGTQVMRRRYKLIADCTESQPISAVCKLRWILKEPADLMTIKNYEALRLMVAAKFLEEKEDWKNAAQNQQDAFKLMDDELSDYLRGIRHTPQIQTSGFGLGSVGGYWSQ